MKFVIKHEIKGRIRAHAVQYRMTFEQADRMQYYLESQDMITSAKVQNLSLIHIYHAPYDQGYTRATMA